MQIHYVATLGFALAVSTAGLAQAETELTDEQTMAMEASIEAGVAEPGSLSLSGSVDRADLTYGVGDTVRFFVETNEDAYVVIVNVGPTGDVTQLFPNGFQEDNHVAADETIEIPAADSGAQIRVAEPVGAELIKFFASNEPITVIQDSQLEGEGAFRSLRGGAPQLARNLEVVANAPPEPERQVVVQHLVLRTVASTGEAGPALSAAPEEPDAAPDETPAQ